MNTALGLERAARLHPERDAVLHGDTVVLSYQQWAEQAAAGAAALRQRGVAPGDRVALFLPNHPDYLVWLYAIWWAGAVAVPINAKLHPREAAWIVGNADARLLLTHSSQVDELQALRADMPAALQLLAHDSPDGQRALQGPGLALQARAPTDLAWLFYTSGTTGRPKGVMLSHRNLAAMMASYHQNVDQPQPDDVMVYAPPISHGAGMYHFAQLPGAGRHLIPASGGFDAAELVALSQRWGRLVLFAAPTMVKRLVDHIAASGAPVDGFKTLVYGGGPMYAADMRRALEVMGQRFAQIYGQGESPMTITALPRQVLADTNHPRWGERLASVGVAAGGVEVRVVNAEGETVPSGTVGEVLVRGDVVTAGYWRNPDASAQALRGGWLWTGDLGAFDADGFLTLHDRSKDVVISGGTNIYPREVEEVLLLYPAVSEVCVIGRPDAAWGEVVVAYVVTRTAVSAAELQEHCLQHLARFKRPKHICFVDALPKNNYGKVLKTALRERERQEHG
jgi:long-chain acyl-CoA synthetase